MWIFSGKYRKYNIVILVNYVHIVAQKCEENIYRVYEIIRAVNE